MRQTPEDAGVTPIEDLMVGMRIRPVADVVGGGEGFGQEISALRQRAACKDDRRLRRSIAYPLLLRTGRIGSDRPEPCHVRKPCMTSCMPALFAAARPHLLGDKMVDHLTGHMFLPKTLCTNGLFM